MKKIELQLLRWLEFSNDGKFGQAFVFTDNNFNPLLTAFEKWRNE